MSGGAAFLPVALIAGDLAALMSQLKADIESATQLLRGSDMLMQARTQELANAGMAEIRKVIAASPWSWTGGSRTTQRYARSCGP